LLTWLLVFSPSANADFNTSRGWFATLSPDERKALQSDLMLLGLYTGFIDGILNADT
jgi:hypothetical protein